MKARQVIAEILKSRPTDASKRWHPDIETQILADSPGFPIRIDENNPNPDLPYDPALITRIGATGRNPFQQFAEWIGIDIDADDHAKGHDADTIARIVAAVTEVSYVDVFRSTGGKGLHLHVPLRVPITSRKQHGHLGRYVLEQVSRDAELDLSQYADIVGGNLWI